MRLLGWILILVGGAVMVYAILQAFSALGGLYQGALTDPLNQPDNVEQDTSKAMLRSVGIGLLGAPFLLAGVVLTRIAWVRRLRRKLAATTLP